MVNDPENASTEFLRRKLEQAMIEVTDLRQRSSNIDGESGAAHIEPMSEGLMDAKVAASEARSEARLEALRGAFSTQFAEVLGELKTSRAELSGDIRATNTKLDTVIAYTSGTKQTVVVTVVGSALALGGLLIGLLAFGNDRFASGLDASSAADAAATRAIEQIRPYLPKEPIVP